MRLLMTCFVLASLFCSGCQSMMRSKAVRSAQADRPSKEEPWVRSAGDLARTEHDYEEVHDPLGLRKIFTSEKAREIERNVGVGD